jgi:hypothetical protein
MPVCVGPSASAVHVAPTLTLNASTNYNQNSGVLNATVTATGNRSITSVEFQWSTSSTFASGNSAWTAASTNTLIPQGTASTARTVTATSLANNTTFYVRFRTTNASGFVTTSSIGSSFKTYRDILVTFTSSSTWTNPVPTSGTSGLAITQLRNLVCRGGGGGGGSISGGGGGGGNITTSTTATISGNVSVTIGGGGGQASSGSTSSIGSVLSAAGGGGGNYGDFAGNGNGGASGNGNAGGTGAFEGGGGGGGVAGVGQNGTLNGPGGNGGAGISGNGEGGRGGGKGTNMGANGGANTGNGGGGAYNPFASPPDLSGDGGSGYAQFNYWGP